jgi:hypothetical protein
MVCGEPFRPRDGDIEFWRTSAGQHFCSEFCADDAEEAQFRKRRAAAATHPGLGAGSPHLESDFKKPIETGPTGFGRRS